MKEKILSFFKDNTKRKVIASVLAVCVVGATTFGVVLANRNTESKESGQEIVASSMGTNNKADLAEEKQTNLEKNEETSVAAETSSEAPKVEKQGDKYIVNGKEYTTETEAKSAAESYTSARNEIIFHYGNEESKAPEQSQKATVTSCNHMPEPVYGKVLVREAWDEPEYEWKDYFICKTCGKKEYGSYAAHIKSGCDSGGYATGADHLPTGRMIHHEAEYENRVVGFKCKLCGKTI